MTESKQKQQKGKGAGAYFWLGGRKIAIEKHENMISIENPREENLKANEKLRFSKFHKVSDKMALVELAEDRDAQMEEIRKDHISHHIYYQAGQEDEPVIITDSFFAAFKDEIPGEQISGYLGEYSLKILRDYGNKRYLLQVTNGTGRNCLKMANQMVEEGIVKHAEPNLVRRLSAFYIPTDPKFEKQWHLYSPRDLTNLVQGAGVNAPGAWDITLGVRDVTVCVADDGFDLTHPDFQGPDKIVNPWNYTGNNTDVKPVGDDYHGTPCGGVAAAEENGFGCTGAAPGCSFMPIRFPLKRFTDSDFIDMFQFISSHADVVSCSWGVGPADAPMSSDLRGEIARLARTGGKRGQGLVFCVAAGNNNAPVKDLDNTTTYKYWTYNWFGQRVLRSYSGKIDRWIAAHPDVITVAACNSFKQRSGYSSWGKDINVCAPSNDFDDLEPGRSLPGRGITTTDNENFGDGFTPDSIFTDRFGGTSSATPLVAGICGLVISANNNLTGPEVRSIIEKTAGKDMNISSETPVNVGGEFIDGFSQWFGYGKVDAAEAVKEALNQMVEPKIIRVENNNSIEIPDEDRSGIVSPIAVQEEGTIRDIRVSVDITHTYIGDLRVDFQSPRGHSIILHNNTGYSTDNIKKTYSVAEIDGLRLLYGEDIKGTWNLKVIDSVGLDVGTLNSWGIKARVQ